MIPLLDLAIAVGWRLLALGAIGLGLLIVASGVRGYLRNARKPGTPAPRAGEGRPDPPLPHPSAETPTPLFFLRTKGPGQIDQ